MPEEEILPKQIRKRGVREGIEAAMTPKEVSTHDQSWGRAEVSVGWSHDPCKSGVYMILSGSGAGARDDTYNSDLRG